MCHVLISTTNRLVLLILFCCAAFESVGQETGYPLIRNYEPKEYGQTPQIWSIVQSPNGLLYFGLTNAGILEYDGHSWNTISTKFNTVSSLCLGESGRIYSGGPNDFGFISTDRQGKMGYTCLREQLRDTADIGTVWYVKTVGNKVYFVTYDNVYEYGVLDKSIHTFNAQSFGKFFGPFVEGDTFYVGLQHKGLLMKSGDSLTRAPHSEYFKSKNGFFDSILNLENGRKIFATLRKGLLLYSTNGSPPLPLQGSNPEFFDGTIIYSGKTVTPNRHVIGSSSKGAILIDSIGRQLNSYDEKRLLQNNGINSLTTDQTKNVWMGLDIGISKTESGLDLSYWNKTNGMKGSVHAIRRYNGVVYVASDQDCYLVNNKNEIDVLENLESGRQNWELSEFRIGSVRKLILGNQDGLFEINGKKAKSIYDGGAAHFFHQSRSDSSRAYSTNEAEFISIRFKDNQWSYEGAWIGVSGNLRGIVEDEAGVLWIGSMELGIIRVEPNPLDIQHPKSVTYFNKSHGLPSLKNCRPISYNHGVLVGTERGVYRFNEASNKFEPFCEFGRQFCDGSTSVLMLNERTDGSIFIVPQNNKVNDIGWLRKTENGTFTWNYKAFRRLPKMASIYSQWQDQDGTVWLGSSEGLFKYDSRQDLKDYEKAFNCLIRKFTVNPDSCILWGLPDDFSHLTLEYKQNSFKLEFAAPFFDQEENIQYSYQLVGHDNEWSTWSRQNYKEYSNLFEGDYTFKVKAKNIYDVESNIVMVPMTIKPPWMRSLWAYLGYVLLFVMFTGATVRWRTLSLKKHNKMLELKILKRTEELTEANSALVLNEEKLHQNNEELKAALENLKLLQQKLVHSEKMASLGQLSAGIAHEINNPLNFISGGVQAFKSVNAEILELLRQGKQVSPEELREREKDIKDLISSIERGIERSVGIISNLRIFSSPSTSIEEDASIDVNACLESTLTLMKMKIGDSRVEVVKNFGTNCYAKANAARINQVFLNIIDNALFALTETAGNRKLEISTRVSGDMILVQIRDNGPGIPDEIQHTIMDPFFTTKEVGEGTGLGLSISYGIVQEHGGQLTFTSEIGQGTEFSIYFPAVSTKKVKQ